MSTSPFVFVFALGLPWFFTPQAFADVTVTAATGGTGLSADNAQNGAAPAFTALGNIVITEPGNGKGDFAAGTGKTLILSAPSGWSFSNGVGAVSFSSGRDISSASIAVPSSNLTVTLTVASGANGVDVLTISGIRAQATEGGSIPASGNILRTSADPGTATITGITNGSTDFGALSQSVEISRLYVV